MNTDLAQKIAAAKTTQQTYQPNDAVAQIMRQKVLVMVVAPAATGKSYIISHAAEQASDFSKVAVFTTRPNRPDDEPGMFRSHTSDAEITEILGKIEQGDVVQYAIHPTHGTIYGSEPADYPEHYNMLAMLSGTVEHMRALPFERTVTVGLVTDSTTWHEWFDNRFPEGHYNRVNRLQEAVMSLEWLTGQPENSIIWLINQPGQPEETASKLIAQTRGETPSDPNGRQFALDCLALARTLT